MVSDGGSWGSLARRKKRLRGDLIELYNYVKGVCSDVGIERFSQSQIIQGNGLKLCQGRPRLGIRKIFLTARVVKHWNRLARDESPSLEVLKKKKKRSCGA